MVRQSTPNYSSIDGSRFAPTGALTTAYTEVNPHSASPKAWLYYVYYRHFSSCLYNSRLPESCHRPRLWAREARKFSQLFLTEARAR